MSSYWSLGELPSDAIADVCIRVSQRGENTCKARPDDQTFAFWNVAHVAPTLNLCLSSLDTKLTLFVAACQRFAQAVPRHRWALTRLPGCKLLILSSRCHAAEPGRVCSRFIKVESETILGYEKQAFQTTKRSRRTDVENPIDQAWSRAAGGSCETGQTSRLGTRPLVHIDPLRYSLAECPIAATTNSGVQATLRNPLTSKREP